MMNIGSSIGLIFHTFMKSRKRIAKINLELCFPNISGAERDTLIKTHFKFLGRGLMELTIAWWWSDIRLKKLNVTITGLHHLQASNKKGRIFLAAHFSSLELSARFLGQFTNYWAMYRPHENPVIQYHYEKYRTRYSLGILTKHDAKKALKALKIGDGIWFAPDQNFGVKGSTFSSFFGVPAATNMATSRLAKMSSAYVIPFVIFHKNNGYEIRFEEPMHNINGTNPEKETQEINDLFEKWAREAPTQYNWIHKRFKDQPDGINLY